MRHDESVAPKSHAPVRFLQGLSVVLIWGDLLWKLVVRGQSGPPRNNVSARGSYTLLLRPSDQLGLKRSRQRTFASLPEPRFAPTRRHLHDMIRSGEDLDA